MFTILMALFAIELFNEGLEQLVIPAVTAQKYRGKIEPFEVIIETTGIAAYTAGEQKELLQLAEATDGPTVSARIDQLKRVGMRRHQALRGHGKVV